MFIALLIKQTVGSGLLSTPWNMYTKYNRYRKIFTQVVACADGWMDKGTKRQTDIRNSVRLVIVIKPDNFISISTFFRYYKQLHRWYFYTLCNILGSEYICTYICFNNSDNSDSYKLYFKRYVQRWAFWLKYPADFLLRIKVHSFVIFFKNVINILF